MDLTNGNDTYSSTTDNEIVNGLAGDDFLESDASNVTLNGGAGNDQFSFSTADTIIIEDANGGTDTVFANLFSFSLAGLLNVENLFGSNPTGGQSLTGNDLNNRMSDGLGANTDQLFGGAGNDRLENNVGADTLTGGTGDDIYIIEAAGIVVENPGEGTDRIATILKTFTIADLPNIENLSGYLNTGQTLTGNAGANRISGRPGADTLDGGAGDDRLFGVGGSDRLIGGTGNDTYYLRQYRPEDRITIVENANQGTDAVSCGLARFSIKSMINVENLYALPELGPIAFTFTGNDRSNLIKGYTLNDSLRGLAGNDTLIGGSGADRMGGDTGNDTLQGGRGQDTMFGGLGRDVFRYAFGSETGKTAVTRDIIRDFARGDDIGLSAIDASSKAAGNNRFVFTGKSEFSDRAGQLRYETVNETGTRNDRTIIEGDINGDGRADFQIELTGLKILAAADFIL
jgi:Ca2+-binding RTX toxin-like protein